MGSVDGECHINDQAIDFHCVSQRRNEKVSDAPFIWRLSPMGIFRRELKYVLPLKSRHLFPDFFSMIDSHKESFSIIGYGLQDVSLEEVFLKVTEQYKTSPNAAAVEAQYNQHNDLQNSLNDIASTP